jgi:hypothetical protein
MLRRATQDHACLTKHVVRASCAEVGMRASDDGGQRGRTRWGQEEDVRRGRELKTGILLGHTVYIGEGAN